MEIGNAQAAAQVQALDCVAFGPKAEHQGFHLLGVLDQPNIPGTIDQHPNWRRRLPFTIEELRQHVDADRLREVMKPRSG